MDINGVGKRFDACPAGTSSGRELRAREKRVGLGRR